MAKQDKYSIVCLWPSEIWIVQERTPDGDWMEAHRCLSKKQEGLDEAYKWINEQEQ